MEATGARVLFVLFQAAAVLQGASAAIGLRGGMIHNTQEHATLKMSSNDDCPKCWLRPTAALSQPETLMAMGHAKIAKRAPFTEDGYSSVVKLKNNTDMATYIRRLTKHLHLYVRDDGALSGMAPHYSGIKKTQTFFALKQELLGIAAIPSTWLVDDDTRNSSSIGKFAKSFVGAYMWDGSSAPLNDVGYHAVARLKNDIQMVEFVRRVVEDMDLYICNKGRINGLVHYYSGVQGVQSFGKLRNELIGGVRDVEPWLSSGESVRLDEAGYRSVAALFNDEEMSVFIKRVAELHGCSVTSSDGLASVVPHFSGTTETQTFALLEKEVKKSCGLLRSKAKVIDKSRQLNRYRARQ